MRLTCDGRDVASLSFALTDWQKFKGLLGTKALDGAMLFPGVTSVHTFFMLYSIDVALCDDEMMVISTQTLKPFRLSKRVPNTRHVIEAQAGSFAQWSLNIGSKLDAHG